MIRNTWYVAGFSDEFPVGALKRRIIAGSPLVMWRNDDNEVVGLDARCAHKRFPLWDGKLLENGTLECAYHGFAFDSSGQCVAIPALHEETDQIPKTARQKKYPVVEQQGLVWVWTGDRAKMADVAVPQTPEIGSADWDTRNTEQIHVKANYRLLIENLFDLTHFYPLHAGNIGSLADARVPVEIERGAWQGNQTLKTIRHRAPQPMPPTTAQRFGITHGEMRQEHEMIGPGLFHVRVNVAPEGKLGTDAEQGFVLYQTITPESEDSLIWRRSTSCRKGAKWAADPSKPLVEGVIVGAPTVIEQDKWAIERQHEMLRYPDEGYREVHIKTDGAMMMARSILNRMDAADNPETGGYDPVRRARGDAASAMEPA